MAPHRLRSIADYHRLRGLPPSAHPLASVIRLEDIGALREDEPPALTQDFYSVAMKRAPLKTLRYGMGDYTAHGGLVYFIAPGQVYALRARREMVHEGWLLLVHPDFLRETTLGRVFRTSECFTYAVNEALALTTHEEARLSSCFADLRMETEASGGHFSKPVVLSYVGLILNLANRAFSRDKAAVSVSGGDLLVRLDDLLREYFGQPDHSGGVPTVARISRTVELSPKRLSSILKAHTGKTTRHYIQEAMIEGAKVRLSTGEATVGEIAYALGFEYTQSFSKFFKAKTGLTPTEYRSGLREGYC